MSNSDSLTYMTDAHRHVVALLERRGLGVQEEVDFPPYRVDVYVPDYHFAVEVDGPVGHSARENDRRDGELWRLYMLRTFRVPHDVAFSELADVVTQAICACSPDAADRRAAAEMAAPWL